MDELSRIPWRNAVKIASRQKFGTVAVEHNLINHLDYILVGAGMHHYGMLLDTGSSFSFATVGELNGRVLGTGSSADLHVVPEVWGVSMDEVEIGHCPPLFLCGQLLAGSQIIGLSRLDLRRVTGIPWAAGVIGTNHLQGMSIVVTQSPPEISLSTWANTDPDWEHIFDLVRLPDDSRIYVLANIQGNTEALLIDTGAALSVATSPAMAAR